MEEAIKQKLQGKLASLLGFQYNKKKKLRNLEKMIDIEGDNQIEETKSFTSEAESTDSNEMTTFQKKEFAKMTLIQQKNEVLKR